MDKYCPRCKADKPTDCFNLHSGRPDGRQPYCRDCQRNVDVAYTGSDNGKAKRRDTERRKYERRLVDCPEKLRARYALRYALRRGRLSRGTCRICGSAETEGHHEDYSKPLDVIWFCRTHHAEFHRTVAASSSTRNKFIEGSRMSARRDPRVDPQDGDVLRKGGVRRVVICREHGQGTTYMANCVQVNDGGWINMFTNTIKKPREKRPTLRQFRRWAANATVEHTA